ncbi:MAG: hypothetical protein P8Y74_18070, partial [Desulfobacterales bacterium]
CEAVFLDGVVTVHCDAAAPVAREYKQLHLFPATLPKDIRFYSCALGRAYTPTRESAADSILNQALSGFDFTTLIEQAYADGVRIFLEMGPHASCTGMIKSILGAKPHLALSACCRGEDDLLTILKCLGTLAVHRVPMDLDALYGTRAWPPAGHEISAPATDREMTLPVGGKMMEIGIRRSVGQAFQPADVGDRSQIDRKSKLPENADFALAEPIATTTESDTFNQQSTINDHKSKSAILKPNAAGDDSRRPAGGYIPYRNLMDTLTESTRATVDAHQAFLDFSDTITRGFEKTFETQTKLLETLISDDDFQTRDDPKEDLRKITALQAVSPEDRRTSEPAFDRDMCMEFAVGSVAKMLGPAFAVVDTYNVRVRLPDEPLMLVDRIISVEGEKQSLGSGRVVTEHDVLADAWYLDGNRAPVCISVEAGQADLFLCAYLGIDHEVKGKRSYRLLDAKVKFHRGLPMPGDVIRYEIEIDRFSRQGETWLFFF